MYTPPPSSQGIDYSLILQWLVVIVGLLLMAYAAMAIKNEKKSYQKDAKWISLGSVKFLIAKWWTASISNSEKLEFVRGDTNYDWKSSFLFEPNLQMTPKDRVNAYLAQVKIETDGSYGSLEETNRADYLIQDQKLLEEIDAYYRLESVGTQDSNDRIYIDVICFKLKSGDGFLLSSQSSILNGCVEGPYFEEAVKFSKLV